MNKKLKRFLIGLCAFIIFIALFWKVIFMLVFGFFWYGFPPTQIITLNERSDLTLGDTWVQDDLFKLSVERQALIIEPDTERKLVRVNILTENYSHHYFDDENEMAYHVWASAGDYDVEEAQATSSCYIKIGETKQFQYQFYVPLEAKEARLHFQVYTSDRSQYYRNNWNIDVREDMMETVDLKQIGSVIARYTEQLDIINAALLDTTKAGDNKVVCYVNDVPILQDELSFRTALGFISKYPRTDAELLDVLTGEKVLQSIAIKHGILPTEEQIAQYIQREQQEEALVDIVEDICASGDLSVDEYWSLYERYNVIRILTAQNVYQYYSAEQSMTEEEYNLQMAEWVEQAEIEDC